MKLIANAQRWLIPTIALLAISACSSVKPVNVSTTPIERTPLALPNPDPLSLDFPNWVVITPDNIDQIWKSLADKNQTITLFALTADGYEQLIVDLAKIKNLLNEQRAIILEYKKYYESEQKK